MLRWTCEARKWKLHDLAVGLWPCWFRGGLQHLRDAHDVDDVERERALTNRLDATVAVFVTKRDECIRLPHLAPRQWTAEESFGVDANMYPSVLCLCEQRVDVACRVDALARRIVRWIRRASS